MTKASDVLLRTRKNIQGIEQQYVKSEEFKQVAQGALIDFIKRVKRKFMPDLGEIPVFTKKNGVSKYVEMRERNKSSLGDLAKPKTSNATATGQMLKAMTYQMKSNGFLLFVQNTTRSKELSGASPKLTNKEVAKYYSIKRDVFAFSEPELQRIIRKAKSDLLKIVRRLK